MIHDQNTDILTFVEILSTGMLYISRDFRPVLMSLLKVFLQMVLGVSFVSMLSVKGKRFKIFFFCYICDRQNSNAKHCMKTNSHKMPGTINSILQTNSEISIDFCNLITYFAEYSVFRLKYSMEKQHKKPQVHSEEYKNLQLLIVTILSYFANSVSSTTF